MKPRHIVMLALSPLIVLLSIDLGIRHTDAYGQAALFVSRDARVAALTGTVDRADFRFWHGFTYVGDRAGFSFTAMSGKRAFIVDVRLHRWPGAWRVRDADIRGPDGSETHISLH